MGFDDGRDQWDEMSNIETSQELGRDIRTGNAVELGIPTDELLLAAVDRNDWAEAQRWSTYLLEEASQIHTVLTTWIEGLLQVGGERILDWAACCDELEHVIGAPPFLRSSRDEMVDAAVSRFEECIRHHRADQVRGRLHEMRRAQWQVHDDLTDWVWGLLTVFCNALGEDALESVFRSSMEEWVTARYQMLSKMTQRQKFEMTIEGMRSHFSGPASSGEIKVEEMNDRWVLSLDPCGSGGRMRRGSAMRNQTSRSELPYLFSSVEMAHDWTWGQKDVCLYCVHCAFVNEIFPIEQTGEPLRITEYSANADDACRWIIYKDEVNIPSAAYIRVGTKPPDSLT